MRRRLFLAAAAVSAACSRLPKRVLVPVPPEAVGEWRRSAMETHDPAGAPPDAARLKPEQWVRAAYVNGQRSIGVSAFGFSSDASAFELQQRWNRGGGDVTYQRKSIFVVCNSPTEPTAALIEFIRMLEKSWP
ncbi:MAG: hypothetical protein IH602_06105 [Bryobacteraceae bacterium]|nr:hypothetical protein [Bryobacteraceae bacterium]